MPIAIVMHFNAIGESCESAGHAWAKYLSLVFVRAKASRSFCFSCDSDGNQHDPMPVQPADQADQPSLIHDDIGERSHPIVIRQYFEANLCLAKPAQPGFVQLTVDFDLVSILRIQTDGLRHIIYSFYLFQSSLPCKCRCEGDLPEATFRFPVCFWSITNVAPTSRLFKKVWEMVFIFTFLWHRRQLPTQTQTTWHEPRAQCPEDSSGD